MNNPISTILVGIGGYGATYGEILLDNTVPGLHLAAIVDPYAKSSRIYDRFKDTVPVYDRLEDFYATGQTADLVFISSPPNLHFRHCITALEGGSHVLCEKPLVPTLDMLNRLDEKAVASGKTLSVGFQWCFSDVMLGLKARILAGEFGRPVFFKNFTCWPRTWAYYRRSAWAGRIKTDDGTYVYDSVVSNATSHHLQNMLFLLGSTMEDSASLGNTYVETYRANDIESFDTCVLRGDVGSAKVYYAASHGTNYNISHPMMHYELENAVITVGVFDQGQGQGQGQEGVCTVHHRDGRVEKLGPALGNGVINKFTRTAEEIRGKRGATCSIRTVRPFTALIDAIFSQVPIYDFPAGLVIKDSVEECTYVKYLHMQLADCFNHGRLPSEMKLPWANTNSKLKPV